MWENLIISICTLTSYITGMNVSQIKKMNYKGNILSVDYQKLPASIINEKKCQQQKVSGVPADEYIKRELTKEQFNRLNYYLQAEYLRYHAGRLPAGAVISYQVYNKLAYDLP